VKLRRYHHATAARLAWGVPPAQVARALRVRATRIEEWLSDAAFHADYVACLGARDQAIAWRARELSRRVTDLVRQDLRSADPIVMLATARAYRRYRLAERLPTAPAPTPKPLTRAQKEVLKTYLEATRGGGEPDEQTRKAAQAALADADDSRLPPTSAWVPGTAMKKN